MDLKPDNRDLARQFAVQQRRRRDSVYGDAEFNRMVDARGRANYAARELWKKNSDMAVSPYHQTALRGIDGTPATKFSGVQGLDALTRAYNVGTTTDTEIRITEFGPYIEALNRLLPDVNMTVHRVDNVAEDGRVVEAPTAKYNPAGFSNLRAQGSDAGVYVLKVSPRSGSGKAHRYIIGGSGYRSKFMAGSKNGREVFGQFFAGDRLKELQRYASAIALEAMGAATDPNMIQRADLAELKREVGRMYNENIKSVRRTNQGRIAAGIAKTVHPYAKSRNFADHIQVQEDGQINDQMIKGGPRYEFGQTMFRQHGGRCAPVGIHASASNTNASNARVKPSKRKFRNGNSTREKHGELHGQEYVACTMGGSMIPRVGPNGFTKGEKNSRYSTTAYRLGLERGTVPRSAQQAREAMFGGLDNQENRMRFVEESNRQVQQLNQQMTNSDGSWFGRTKGKKPRRLQAMGEPQVKIEGKSGLNGDVSGTGMD